MKANPLGNLEEEVVHQGVQGTGSGREFHEQATVPNSPHPAPPITSRTAIEERRGSFGGGIAPQGHSYPEK